jgi:hypothetical protein
VEKDRNKGEALYMTYFLDVCVFPRATAWEKRARALLFCLSESAVGKQAHAAASLGMRKPAEIWLSLCKEKLHAISRYKVPAISLKSQKSRAYGKHKG